MTREKALEYLDKDVRVNYENKIGPHARAGRVAHITKRKMILEAFNGADHDFEYYIPLIEIKRVYELKPKEDAATYEDIS